MDELVLSLKKCLSNTFVFYFKTHSFHWNVEGINFPTYHSFFGNLYEDLFSAIDPLAEEIRALNVYAPVGLNEMYKYSTIEDSKLTGDSISAMLSECLKDNLVLLSNLNDAFSLATKENNQGLADFIAGRIDIHKKHEWMIRSCLKGA